MGVLLSLATAALYGSADFCGGLASVRVRTGVVLFWAHLIGLFGVALASLLIADSFVWRDVGLGAAGGLAGLFGVFLLYRRLALGPMHVVAPLSGVASAAMPAMWGVLAGERLSVAAWVGIFLALVAIVLVSVTDERSSVPITAGAIIESLASGLGFGTFFVLLAETSDASAPWPVAAARVTSVVTLGVALAVLSWRSKEQADGSASSDSGEVPAEKVKPAGGLDLWAIIAWAGLGDTAANVTFLFATQRADLAVVSVLASLYPLATVVLARIVLSDRMTPRQFTGLAVALVGTALIVGGG